MIRISYLLCACLLCFGSGSIGGSDLFEQRNGIGILLIHEPASTLVLFLYDSPDERATHSRMIEMPYLAGGRIVEGFYSAWEQLVPFEIFPGESGPYLLCMEVGDAWYRIRLSDGKDYWIRQEERADSRYKYLAPRVFERLELVPWSTFMAQKAWVGRKDPRSNPIRKRPSLHAATIAYPYGDCLRPTEAKGWWIKVRPENGEGCISDTLPEGLPPGLFKEGWVQWRNDSMFLLRTTY